MRKKNKIKSGIDLLILTIGEESLGWLYLTRCESVRFSSVIGAHQMERLFLVDAFWVLRPMPDFPDENLAYLVTAAHVIRKITDMNIDKIILRLNFTDGNWGAIETQPSSWFFHEDPAADVAVLRIGFDVREHDHRGWELRYSATPEEVQKHGIGPGDDLFFIGLFTKHYGTTKNIPIVRMGNIAAMPSIDNPVKTKIGPMIAYLAEARSIGGLSGSPVFVDIYGITTCHFNSPQGTHISCCSVLCMVTMTKQKT